MIGVNAVDGDIGQHVRSNRYWFEMMSVPVGPRRDCHMLAIRRYACELDTFGFAAIVIEAVEHISSAELPVIEEIPRLFALGINPHSEPR